MSIANSIRIGTRQSPLALKQTDIVAKKLKENDPSIKIDIIPISTTGDEDKTTPLWQIGGKGVFIKTLEQALLDNRVDIAVHSLKDVTSELPENLELAAFLVPESCSDVLILKEGYPLSDLSAGATIGTSSLRRKALLKRDYPNLKPVDIRGNVETRLNKVFSGELDGVILSEAGLIRLGLEHHISYRFDKNTFLPAPGQGVIAVECRKDNTNAKKYCALLNDEHQSIISNAELLFLKTVGFDCRDPLGLYTLITDNRLTMKAFKSNADFSSFHHNKIECSLTDIPHNISSFARTIKEK